MKNENKENDVSSKLVSTNSKDNQSLSEANIRMNQLALFLGGILFNSLYFSVKLYKNKRTRKETNWNYGMSWYNRMFRAKLKLV